MRQRLVVMVKEPRPGRVKTRLARGIGPVAAAWWMRHQVARLLRRIRDPRWEVRLAVSPDRALRSAVWPADLPRVAQGGGDLGARMGRILSRRSNPSGSPTLIIGSDIPGVTRAHIARAFRALASHDAVVGPAPDGGYWLVGIRRAPPAGMFDGVRWSTDHALADTLASIPSLRVAVTDTLSDVDDPGDLKIPADP
jgi:rSAM/selenodomain-associated transferase 1